TAAEKVADRPVAKGARIFDVERQWLRTAQLVADVLGDHRHFDAELLEHRMHTVAQKDAQGDVGDVDVAVRVGLRARRGGQRAGVHALGDSFRDDCTPLLWPAARRLIIAPTMVSTTCARSNLFPRNSSGITASVAPADLHMLRARKPDFRPIVMARYHLPVLRASSISDSTIVAPTARAVSKPKVGAFSGSGRSLSIVLGTVTIPILPLVRSAIRVAP